MTSSPLATAPGTAPRGVVACVELSAGHGRTPALSGVSLTVGPGETLALLGPSGSGKTTLLNAVAGFAPPLSGEIWLGGVRASAPGRCLPPERRGIGMVFQDYALWPHMSVLDTVAYPLRRAGASRAAARRGAMALLERMSLAALASRRPGELSGGEQQRVGLARALACEPAVYLFDEPTAHLDTQLRGQVLDEVARQRASSGAAAIYATHDAAEALAIADAVAVLHSGGLAQAGPPADVYAEPADLRVARLTGPVSLLRAPVLACEAGTATVGVGGAVAMVPCTAAPGVGPAAAGAGPAGPVIMLRPDWAGFAADGVGLPGTITDVRFRGPHTDYHVDTPAGTVLLREFGPPSRGRGPVRWSLSRAHLLSDSPSDPATP